MCEDKFEFESPKRNPLILAAPHLALTEQNLPLTEHVHENKFEFDNPRRESRRGLLGSVLVYK